MGVVTDPKEKAFFRRGFRKAKLELEANQAVWKELNAKLSTDLKFREQHDQRWIVVCHGQFLGSYEKCSYAMDAAEANGGTRYASPQTSIELYDSTGRTAHVGFV